MAKTAQANEPSMEEILASIRRIIADEETSSRPAPVVRPVAREVEPEPVAEQHWQPEDTAEPANEAEAEMSADPIFPPTDYDSEAQEMEQAEAESALETEPQPAAESEPAVTAQPLPVSQLLSPGPDAMVSAAFNQLANTILASQARTLEDLVQDMLRPMLRGWLDDNLPPLVERLVREEIERVSRGGKRR